MTVLIANFIVLWGKEGEYSMNVCTFFGHRECFGLDRKVLRNAIETLIHDGVDTFYVGNQGQFDAMVRSTLRELRTVYPHIRYSVVLAYLPAEKRDHEDHTDTMYPEGIEDGPPRFAIERRNKWMIGKADYVICYLRCSWGGAYKFSQLAKRRGETVINICEAGIAVL